MDITIDTAVPFWQQDLVVDYGQPVAVLLTDKHDSMHLSTGVEKTQVEVVAYLKGLTQGIVSCVKYPDGKHIAYFLVGDYVLELYVDDTPKDQKKFRYKRLRLISHDDRRKGLRNGIVINFDGIRIFNGSEYRRAFEKSTAGKAKSSAAVDKLLDLLRVSLIERAGDLRHANATQETNIKLSDAKYNALDCLQRFVDTEYDLECLAQQLEPPFFYQHIKASTVKQTYRQFYDLTLVESDYDRVLKVQPKLLSVASDDGTSEEIKMEVVELEVCSGKPVIQVSIERQVSARQIPAKGDLKLMALPTLHKIRSEIIEQLQSGETKNPWLLSLLAKEYEPPAFTAKPITVDSDEFPPTDSQQAAIDAGAATPDYSLVLGPPGTGKTTVILEWVRHFVSQGQRVLVTSQNNKAVDNVLERLADEPEFECLRIGNETKVSSSLHDILLDNKATDLQNKLFENSKALTAHLDTAQSLLEYLDEYQDYVKDSISKLDEAKQLEASLTTTLATQKSQLDVLASEENKLVEQLQLSQQQKQQRETQRPALLTELLTLGWHRYQLRRLRKRINEIQQLLAAKRQQCKQLASELENSQERLNDTRQSSARFANRVQTIEAKHPGDYRAYFQLPELRSLMSGKLATYCDRVSRIQTTLKDWFDDIHSRRRQSLYPLLLEHVNVVGATCIGINTKEMFRNIDFDVVIVDEAGQIQVHNLMVPLSRSKKAILVGDHKQIRPVVQPEITEELQERGSDPHELQLYERSWFELLWEQSPTSRKFMLDTQFRCPSEISDFVSQAFYDNKYYAGANKLNCKPLLSFCSSPIIWLDTAEVKNNHEERNQGQFVGNRSETNIIVEVCRRAIEEMPELIEQRELGIIVPYRKHLQQIQKRIKKLQKTNEFPELSMPLDELVASVDSFQGQERELIIFACSRSNKHGNVGFLKAWQRLNVALTRAKKQVVMVGNTDTMTRLPKSAAARGDRDFKQAMQLLVKQLNARNAILPGFRFFPKKASPNNKPRE